jgi:dihydrolipoamide dehydrogenase
VSNGYDVLVIGAGPGGYPAAIRSAQLGLKTACVEKESLGGVCLNWGCIPSKALLKTAELVNKIEHADDFGVTVGEVAIDYPKVIARSRKIAKRFQAGVRGLFKKYGVTQLKGTATITGEGTVTISSADGDQVVSAKHIIVATGAGAKTFPGIEPDGERILTYREAIVLKEKPASVAILGAGAIGIEFAYFWNAMGVDVTVVEGLDEILPAEDKEIAAAARKEFEKQGIKFVLGTFVKEVKRDGEDTLTLLQDGTELRAHTTLIALGIRPNSEGIGLETLSINTERGFIAIDNDMRTSAAGVYAVGDVTTRGGLAHTATAQAHVCADRIAGHEITDVPYDSIPGCTYAQPQVASVGLTEEQAKEKGLAYKVGRFPFMANGKAQGAGHPEGFVKVLIGEKYGEIIGAHIVGSDATEMIASYTIAQTHEATAESYVATIHAHPTNGEAMLEAVAQALGTSVHI